MTEAEEERFRRFLTTAATNIGVPLSMERLSLCVRFVDRLLTVNEQMNLTRITEPEAMAIKHFADSLTVLPALRGLPTNARLIDVGTGAGFPGVVLKIAEPTIQLTLLDSLAKRLSFLTDTVNELGLTGVQTLHARAEDAGRLPLHRDTYDIVTARAVAALPVLLEWCGPLVRVGGRFVAMKGANIADELAASGSAADKLGLRRVTVYTCELPTLQDENEPAERHLIVYEKIRATPRQFPRKPAEIKASPL